MRGYSLLETFIAVLLVSILFFALVGMYPSAMASMRRASHMSAATNLAREAIDTAMLANPPASQTYHRTLDGVDYTVDEVVKTVTLGPGTPRQTFEITVTVVWFAGDGSQGPSSLTFETAQYNFINPK